MKKIISILIIVCMLCPVVGFSEEGDMGKIFVFGDEWAADWCRELKAYVKNEAQFVSCASDGDLLSNIEKEQAYKDISSGDVVILSYGTMEKDRPGDKNADFKKNLEKTVNNIRKKGAEVLFVSICSSMRFNSLTGKMEETKNFYTETIRSYAKDEKITYIDLANLTAQMANKLGSGNINRLYKNTLALTEYGNGICAYEIFKELVKIPALDKMLTNAFYTHKAFSGGKVEIDVFYEEDFFEEFAVYIKGGVNIKVNSVWVNDGDSVTVCKSENGKITIEALSCEKVQVSPIYKFVAEGYETTSLPFEKSMLPGIYDVTVRKTEALKASVYLNNYMIASNLDMPGTQKVPEAAEHTFKSYHLDEKQISVKVTGLTDKLNYIYFAPSPIIYEEKPTIFLGGDSTVCNYYPLVRTGEEADGTVMTGWGMILHKYVDANVLNLAASGDWAANWLKNSFPVVEKEGKKGDLFIVQFGINDLDKSNLEDMTNALSEMIDRCAAKGIIPVLVSPQISAGYGWGDESDIGKSDGGRYEAFFSAVRDLGVEKGTFYVDLTDLSAGWFSEIGREAVYKKYHLWDYENNAPGDMMHLSYKGADAICRFFVMGLKKLADSNATDKWGNNLSSLKIW